MTTRRGFLVMASAAAAAGCLGGDLGGPHLDVDGRVEHWTPPSTEVDVDLTADVEVEDLEVPTDVAFTDSGYVVSERPGYLTFVEDGEAVERKEVPGVDVRGDSGLLAVETVEERLFLYHTTQLDNRLVEYDIEDEETEVVFRGVPAGSENNGGALEHSADDALWLSTGDGRDPESANDRASPGGAVLRFTLDSLQQPEIYAKGLRDPTGLAFLPDDTPVVVDSGGFDGGDEVNVVYRGGDYGWPATRDPEIYREHGYTLPLVHQAEDAPGFAGCTWIDGDGASGLRDRLVVSALDGEALYSVTPVPSGGLDGVTDGGFDGELHRGDTTDPNLDAAVQKIFSGDVGRLRNVVESPDGALLALTSNREYAGEGQAFILPDDTDGVVRLI